MTGREGGSSDRKKERKRKKEEGRKEEEREENGRKERKRKERQKSHSVENVTICVCQTQLRGVCW